MQTGLLLLVFYVAAGLSLHIICYLIKYLAHLVNACSLAYLRGGVCKIRYVKCGAIAVAGVLG